MLFSCEARDKKPDHSDLIPEKKLPELLARVYMADGLLSLPSIRAIYPKMDSISGYEEVLARSGYSKEAMDRTLKYYFVSRPKRLEKIYDRTLAMLTSMESEVEKENLKLQEEVSNIWRGKEFYVIPDPSGSDTASVNMPLEIPGVYTLSFRAAFFPGDELNPAGLSLFTTHRDSSMNGKRSYIRWADFIKDGQPHDYAVRIVVPPDRPLRLRGTFYDTLRHPEPWEKNALFTNIRLTFTLSAV